MREDSRTHLPAGTQTTTHWINAPFADLMTASGIGTQALMGQRFEVIETSGNQSRGALYSLTAGAQRIDYIGSLPNEALSRDMDKRTHRVTAVMAAIFEHADIKSKLIGSLPRNAQINGHLQDGFFKMKSGGYIHLYHLAHAQEPSLRSYTDIAADMVGLPYIWGGTGHIGVDCSGLVQSALAAMGVDAPRDADQQEAALGRDVPYSDRIIGDLLFWPGHVGIVVKHDQVLHANAYHMSVAIEPVLEAVARIGAVRRVKRLSALSQT